MTVGDRIKQRRIELGLSQEELAKKVGYKSRSSINKIELARDLPLRKVELMAKALDTTPGYLMGWDGIDFFTYPPDYKEGDGLFFNTDPAFHKGDREEALAMTLYELYQKASPEIQQAVDVLLKVDKHS